MGVKNYKFGISRRMMKDCLSPEDMELIESQIRLGHEFDNARRELYFNKIERYRQARRELSPEFDRLQSQVEGINEAIAAEFASIKEERKKQRTATPKGIEPIQEKIKNLKLERAVLLEKSDKLKANLASNAELKAFDEQNNERFKSEEKALRSTYEEKGSYSGTRGQIEVSVSLKKTRRFARFDGSGCLCVQIQHQEGNPYRLTKDLVESDNLFWIGRLMDTRGTEKRRQGFTEIRECFMRITGRNLGCRCIKLPVIFHRQLPDGVVKRVILTKSKKANRDEYHLLISVDTGINPDITNDQWCAIRTGWTRVKDGIEVVAAKGIDGKKHKMVLDNKHLEDLDKLDLVKKQRDDRFNEIIPQLDEYLKARKQYLPDWINEFCQYRFNWHGMKKLAILRSKLIQDDGAEERRLLQLISPWVSQDKKQWQHEVNLHRRIRNRRNDWYRKFVKALSIKYGIIFVAKTDVADVLKKDNKVEDNEWHNTKANRQAATAAPSTLIEYLRQSFPNRVVEVSTAYLATTCSYCGTRNKKSESRRMQCKGCGRVHDVLDNTINNIIARGKKLIEEGELDRLREQAESKREKAKETRKKKTEGRRKASKKETAQAL